MALTKEDLGQIKEAVAEVTISDQFKETIKGTVVEVMVSEPIKKVLKETMLEVMEPMMAASQKEFEKIGEQLDRMDEKLDDLDKSNNQAHENTSLRLNEACPVK
ncbi:hypothetical protein KJ854_00735 [Patescibacteria group bacterium]|nr:hypothetical protein [Patescibacteria group bacterium]